MDEVLRGCQRQSRARRIQLCGAGKDADYRVHKDKPPGIFDLSERSLRYAAGFCFVVGFVISVIVRIGFVLAKDQFSKQTPWSGF